MLWVFILAIAMPISLAGKQNLADIKWEHAVNSNDALTKALDGDVQMIEADVSIGIVVPTSVEQATQQLGQAFAGSSETKNAGEKPIATDAQPPKADDAVAAAAAAAAALLSAVKKPIMSHGEPTSDITLEDFLTKVIAYNGNKDNDKKTKGVKLDFKSIDAVKQSIDILKTKAKDLKAPLWINADIVAGPGEPTTTPVDAKQFFEAIEGAKELESTTLSIGWTTGVNNTKVEGYTKDHVQFMIKAIEDNKINGTKHEITFPVRAVIAAESKDTLHQLYDSVSKKNKVTFTLWTGATDKIDSGKLQKVINSFGAEKIYADLPKDEKDKLKFETSGASTLVKFGMLNVAVFLFALFFRNGLH